MDRSKRAQIVPLLTLTAITMMAVAIFGSGPTVTSLLTLEPANAQQRVSISDVWQQVYQQLPDLPKENKYISKETGHTATNNTLIGRLIRYHVYVKGRAPTYRLDWKLTLADYLDVNEPIYDNSYPGRDVLRINPLDGDRAAIAHLNRTQRDALVQVLVNIFTTPTQATTNPNVNPSSVPGQATPPLPQAKPGDARLLR